MLELEHSYDELTLSINDVHLMGCLKESILERRVFELANYLPLDNSTKLFKAQWFIFDGKLHLAFVNALIEDTCYYTTDIVPEFPDEELMMFYPYFTGQLTFIPDNKSENQNLNLPKNKEFLILTIEKGILKGVF